MECIFRALQGPLNVHCIRIRAAAVRTLNTLIKYTCPELCSAYTERSTFLPKVVQMCWKSPQWQCTDALNLHSSQLQCIFSTALNIPSNPHSVLHCRYPETILNPHSTSMGDSYGKSFGVYENDKTRGRYQKL